MKEGYAKNAAFAPRAGRILVIAFAVLTALAFLMPDAAWARSRLKEVGYVDGYEMAQRAYESEPDLGWREYAAWAQERLKTIDPYPRHYVKGFEEGARDAYRKRKMDVRPEEVDFSLRPEGALELLKRPEKE